MIKDIHIENYKLFDKLEVKDFKRINFFVGENNCGKTSLLEAILFNVGIMANPNEPTKVLPFINIRRSIKTNNKTVGTIFYNFDTNNNPKIISTLKDDTRMELGINVTYKNKSITSDINTTLSRDSMEIEGINFEYKNNGYVGNSKITLNSQNDKDEVNFNIGSIDKKYSKIIGTALYITPFAINTYINHLKELIKKNMEQEIVKYFKFFDKKINNITESDDTTFFTIDGISEKVSINLMGDGLKRYLSIIIELIYLKMFNIKTGVVLIDEIENGLHIKSIKELLRSILKLSETIGIQMFITTHSYDVLRTLYEVANEEENKNMKDDIAIIKIVHTDKAGYKSYNYNVGEVHNLFENGNDVREVW